MLIGAIGVYKEHTVFLALPPILGLYISFSMRFSWHRGSNFVVQLLLGNFDSFFGSFVFACRASFYLFGDKSNTPGIHAAIVSTLALAAFCISTQNSPNPPCAPSAPIPCFTSRFKAKPVNINNSYDISYGTYLYARPIASLTILYHPSIAPFICFALP